ncbi:MAG: bifunctional (p)ppGpp synthetase/guanosine-3',5'-bis(diphosphate) 3'-pyrophosphohydrolase [Anaerolineae bacterium]|nr:bifunctional (p)ppGpp synthetase/guanosine-3',5'-bis(diphosphate) 3'-pyrophosphohydrolase [Anaerolineae bacterium]MDW8170979.1 bifunctional (p)ppGpp synthetase/guanosine-3',5'-bis(diphosphate) 3'-pyrophosphohydrolase [Anaerolineae bacterium]
MVSATSSLPRDLESLLASLPHLELHERSLVERAYFKAEKAHHNMKRDSGEPYFTHCIAVANILAEMNLDGEAIAAALLHDTIEDAHVTVEELNLEFGPTVTHLVDSVTKLRNLPKKQATNDDGEKDTRRTAVIKKDKEHVRKMLMAMDSDVRVVLIKLADRLHNMRTLGYVKAEKQKRIAQETMDIYVPLANRLGIWQIKWELEDLAFRYLNPEAYRSIANSLEERRADREEYVQRIAKRLCQELEKNGITQAHISARPKHISSIYKKMSRKGVSIEHIYDMRAVRVIVDTIPQCYLVLGVVHQLWIPIPGEFDDYIAAPKDNFYRSLHTAVYDENGKTLEVQIRTWEMHEHAEYGIAAHWRYKEGKGERDDNFERRIAFLRRLMEAVKSQEIPISDFLSSVRTDVFENRLYVLTPKGDVIDLPVGSTPIDFAYHIHTDIGHRCRGAKVNGRIVNLDYKLKAGEQVEIITDNRGGPSLDWLNPELGYTFTERARSKIRQWFRKQDRENHLALGRETLKRELKKLGIFERSSFEAMARSFKYERVDDFLVAIGAGDITGTQIANRVLEEENQKRQQQQAEERLLNYSQPAPTQSTTESVHVMGTSGMLVTYARCCHPVPGDPIIGYTTKGLGVTVHRLDCRNVPNLDKERLLPVSWGQSSSRERYVVPIEITALDRHGLLADISTLIAKEDINIAEVRVVTRDDIATLYMSVCLSDPVYINRILTKIHSIPSVVDAKRRYQD